MKTEITKIKLQLKDREIELTADEAREILAELSQLFKMAEKVREVHHHHHHRPAPAPIVIERDRPHWPEPWKIWCGTSGADKTLCMVIGQLS